MITEIRLSQIKDTYNGNEDILIPLINLFKKIPLEKITLPEAVLVNKSPEWITKMQVYEPFPIYSYLIKALKLAYPDISKQSRIYLDAIVEYDILSRGFFDEVGALEALLESSKLKVLISKGDKFINAYANNIINQEKLSSKLSMFAELINNAEVDNGAE
jgi:hypothetical protein